MPCRRTTTRKHRKHQTPPHASRVFLTVVNGPSALERARTQIQNLIYHYRRRYTTQSVPSPNKETERPTITSSNIAAWSFDCRWNGPSALNAKTRTRSEFVPLSSSFATNAVSPQRHGNTEIIILRPIARLEFDCSVNGPPYADPERVHRSSS